MTGKTRKPAQHNQKEAKKARTRTHKQHKEASVGAPVDPHTGGAPQVSWMDLWDQLRSELWSHVGPQLLFQLEAIFGPHPLVRLASQPRQGAELGLHETGKLLHSSCSSWKRYGPELLSQLASSCNRPGRRWVTFCTLGQEPWTDSFLRFRRI